MTTLAHSGTYSRITSSRITAPRFGSSLGVKHALDRVLSVLLLVLCAPLFFVIALAIKATSAGPVFRPCR